MLKLSAASFVDPLMKVLRSSFPACFLLLYGSLPQASWAVSDTTHDATRTRPLFAPTRRPPAKPVAAVADPVPVQSVVVDTTPAVEVRGVIFGNKHPIAIIKLPSHPRMVDVAIGSDIDGWIVDEIHRRSIVLRHDDRTITLSMPEPGH